MWSRDGIQQYNVYIYGIFRSLFWCLFSRDLCWNGDQLRKQTLLIHCTKAFNKYEVELVLERLNCYPR